MCLKVHSLDPQCQNRAKMRPKVHRMDPRRREGWKSGLKVLAEAPSARKRAQIWAEGARESTLGPKKRGGRGLNLCHLFSQGSDGGDYLLAAFGGRALDAVYVSG